MGVKRVLKSKYTWIGVVGGMVAGPWATKTLANLTGVKINLPRIGGSA